MRPDEDKVRDKSQAPNINPIIIIFTELEYFWSREARCTREAILAQMSPVLFRNSKVTKFDIDNLVKAVQF